MNVPDWEEASQLIFSFESFVAFPYDDSKHPARRWFPGVPLGGTLTIGIGNTDRAVIMPFVESGREMTFEEGWADFQRILPGYWTRTAHHFTTDLNGNQCAALTSFSYNAGPAAIRAEPALLAAINERRFVDAAELWKTTRIRPGSNVETGLRRRRAAEAVLFATPVVGGPETGGDITLPTEFTYIFEGQDFLWLGAERIHTRCGSGDVLEGLRKGGQIVALGPKSAQFHEVLLSLAQTFAAG